MKELNVKVGDKVAYYSGGFSKISSICTVSRVTPTGRIRLKEHEGIVFDKYGKEMGKIDPWAGRDSILELTPEIEKQIIETSIIKQCLREMHNIKEIDYKNAIKILEVLKENE